MECKICEQRLQFKCGHCDDAFYCSYSCAQKDWKMHKLGGELDNKKLTLKFPDLDCDKIAKEYRKYDKVWPKSFLPNLPG